MWGYFPTRIWEELKEQPQIALVPEEESNSEPLGYEKV
jgi:hypothetical protein